MKKFVVMVSLLTACLPAARSQVFMTRTGFIGFYSKTPFEDIKAENNQVFAAIDAGRRNIAFAVLLKGFVFTKELMQEHFNENYVESDKYPKASFNGSYTGDVNLNKEGAYHVTVKGNLTLHNVTRAIEESATMEVKGGKLSGSADFLIKPEDFGISIPSIVRDKIAREMTIHVRIDCTPK
ncbi:MAG: YceI family protein [Bacteroidota bacterium]|nr:YceI family protein [Bacteroidota bacterium]MDP4215494.1 YceI family protein [Bacteroidota bacterium]MDP4247395.1 YceI family protein [Bacteroidota bacterium]MDP4252549.1 YceI family protein [Bacteroidota bacterium]MDP4257815.1 YceI family protein [Bacteroidota bacterium]